MSILSALRTVTGSTVDPLTEILKGLPSNTPEETPGVEWERLKDLLELDTSPGQLLISTLVPTADRKGSRFRRTVADPAWSDMTAWSREGENVYFGLSKVPDEWQQGNGKRGDAKSCLPRRFVGVDFDLDFGTHAASGITLPMAVTAIERFPFRPRAVVFSGGGLHAYYGLAGKADKEAIAWVGDRVNGWFARETDPATWDSKPTVDIARILRVPGTLNHKGMAPTWVRLVHEDPNASPITRDAAELWPTFADVKRIASASTGSLPPRARRELPSVRRLPTYDSAPPWDAFNEVFDDEDLLCALLERLGAEVAGSTVRMPGNPREDPNPNFSANIHRQSEDGTIRLTIHGTATCSWWAQSEDRASFRPYDLLTRTFDGDRRATARYVRRSVLPDPERWLSRFEWSPGQPAPDSSTSAFQPPRASSALPVNASENVRPGPIPTRSVPVGPPTLTVAEPPTAAASVVVAPGLSRGEHNETCNLACPLCGKPTAHIASHDDCTSCSWSTEDF